jgi:outer membrane protein
MNATVIACALAAAGALSGAAAFAQTPLSLPDAEQTALKNHPQIQAAQLGSQAAKEATREARSAYFPFASGSVTGADAASGSRIAAGGLNNPVIFDRFATGVSLGQLVTDFGRTRALVGTSALRAQAQDQAVLTERASVLLDVDRAYFSALRAQAVQRVAQQTVDARQLVVDQVSALAGSGLKSGLDVSFAKVNLSTAQLLLVQARNDTDRALAQLATTLGQPNAEIYGLSEEPLPPAPPGELAPLLAAARRDRPELEEARLSEQAASRFADAEGDLVRPSVSALGAFGVTPYHQTGIDDRYSAVGVNVNVPIFTGGLFSARHAEAVYRAQASAARTRDLENRINRDVDVAWLDARTAFERLDLTNQLLDQATQALDLAQSRYNLGLSSIVELSQAQLNQTQAQLEQASAKYEYQVQAAALSFAIGARK